MEKIRTIETMVKQISDAWTPCYLPKRPICLTANRSCDMETRKETISVTGNRQLDLEPSTGNRRDNLVRLAVV